MSLSVTLKNTPEQNELIKAMGSNNMSVARQATEAVAAFLGPVIKEVLKTAGTATRIYRDISFNEDDDQTIPLDLFYNEGTGYITVWSQNTAGGLPTSQVEGVKELKFGTYRIDSAVSFNKKYARKSRLDVVSKSIERLAQEILVRQEKNAWAVILKALAEASTKTIANVPGTSSNVSKHIIPSTTADVFVLNDLNNLLTRIKRINESFSGNTPVQPYTNGPTDLYVSPEIKAQIRAFTFASLDTSANNTKQYLPDDLKMQIWNAGGMQSVFGININEMIEFGDGQRYNQLFNIFTAGQSVPGSNSGAWQTTDQILVAIDNTRGVFLRPIKNSEDTSSSFNVLPDGQFDGYGARVEKTGFYGFLEEGRLCLDARAVAGLVV
jgi:hypothetical protein